MRIDELLVPGGTQTLTSGQTVEHAARRMLTHGLSFLPVCRAGGGPVVGVVSERDIVTKAVAQARATELCSVDEIMARDFARCRPDDAASEVYDRMIAEGLDRMVVQEPGGRLAGVIEKARLAAALARTSAPPARRLRRSA